MDNNQMNNDFLGHVLIIDDVYQNVLIVRKTLENAGYKISYTTNSLEAYDYAQTLHPDLILLDIIMPEKNGFDVCSQLKQDPIIKDIPVIFLTAQDDTNSIVNAFKLGGVDYITKPFNRYELVSRVKSHIELKQSRDEQDRLIKELKQSIEEINKLRGLIPICSYCKKIRNDSGYWKQLEEYIKEFFNTEFSHGICPECMKLHFPEILKKKNNELLQEELNQKNDSNSK